MAKKVCGFIVFFLFFCWASSVSVQAEDAADKGVSTDEFCFSCHENEGKAISENGLAHQSELNCTNCHQGHKPKSFENIPACSLCHAGTPHYDQQQCLNCHRDPHQPLQIKLPKKALAECLTCHSDPGTDFNQSPSYHSQLVCTDCHYEHGFMPQCLSCHKSHGPQMVEQDCQTCHAPHKPLEMYFATTEIPTSFCAPCHTEAGTLLAASSKKHHDLTCVECHEQHAAIPDCRDCHGEPHADAMHTKFPRCGDCHGIAHDLQ